MRPNTNSRADASAQSRASTTRGRGESRPWLRLYRDALHNPKVVMLNDRQHRAWHNCLLMADDTGTLPPMRDIACHLRMTLQEAEWVVGELVEAGLVDVDALGAGPRRYVMHDWNAHQYVSDSSTERVRKHREKKRQTAVEKERETRVKRFSDDGVTAPESDTDSEEDKVLLEERNIDFDFDGHVSPRDPPPAAPSQRGSATGAWPSPRKPPPPARKPFDRDAEAHALDRLRQRAEGLGLPVDEFSETMAEVRPRNPTAYLTSLAVGRLQGHVALPERQLRAALWGNEAAYAAVCSAMLEAA